MAASRWISQRGQEWPGVNVLHWWLLAPWVSVGSPLTPLHQDLLWLLSEGGSTRHVSELGPEAGVYPETDGFTSELEQSQGWYFYSFPLWIAAKCSLTSKINIAYACLNANLSGTSRILRNHLLKADTCSPRLCALLAPGTGLSLGSKYFLRHTALVQPW